METLKDEWKLVWTGSFWVVQTTIGVQETFSIDAALLSRLTPHYLNHEAEDYRRMNKASKR